MGYIAIIDTGIDDSSPAYLHVKKQYVLKIIAFLLEDK